MTELARITKQMDALLAQRAELYKEFEHLTAQVRSVDSKLSNLGKLNNAAHEELARALCDSLLSSGHWTLSELEAALDVPTNRFDAGVLASVEGSLRLFAEVEKAAKDTANPLLLMDAVLHRVASLTALERQERAKVLAEETDAKGESVPADVVTELKEFFSKTKGWDANHLATLHGVSEALCSYETRVRFADACEVMRACLDKAPNQDHVLAQALFEAVTEAPHKEGEEEEEEQQQQPQEMEQEEEDGVMVV
jgi:hypothetical protein